MALNGNLLSKLIYSQCSARGVNGSEMLRFSSALGEGTVESFIKMNEVQTIDTGVLTVGVGKGKMTGITASALTGAVVPLMLGQNIFGISMRSFTEGICAACELHFNQTNEVTTAHTSVSIGSGVGKVLNLIPSIMESRILSKMAGYSYNGTMLKPFVNAFSTGFCNNVMATAVVNVIISGTASPLAGGSPIPSTGVGKGKVK